MFCTTFDKMVSWSLRVATAEAKKAELRAKAQMSNVSCTKTAIANGEAGLNPCLDTEFINNVWERSEEVASSQIARGPHNYFISSFFFHTSVLHYKRWLKCWGSLELQDSVLGIWPHTTERHNSRERMSRKVKVTFQWTESNLASRNSPSVDSG